MKRFSPLVAALVLGFASPVLAQRAPNGGDSPSVAPPGRAPGDFKPDPDTPTAEPDVWIFSGELSGSHEPFSGTLVVGKGETQFELKLAKGSTCDGHDLAGEIGLVRLKEITCTDDRVLRALFVPQGGQELKVFGHVGDERFVTSAHLLGAEALPDKKQTAEPTAPALEDRPGGMPPK